MAVGVKLSPYVVKSFNFDMYVTCICTHFSPDTPCLPSVLFKTSSNFNLMHAAIKPMASCECRGPSHSLNLFFYYSWSTNEKVKRNRAWITEYSCEFNEKQSASWPKVTNVLKTDSGFPTITLFSNWSSNFQYHTVMHCRKRNVKNHFTNCLICLGVRSHILNEWSVCFNYKSQIKQWNCIHMMKQITKILVYSITVYNSNVY